MTTDNSPLTDDIDDDGLSPDDVFEIVYFRAASTDEDWKNDAASSQFTLSRAEAARRLDVKDYSPL